MSIQERDKTPKYAWDWTEKEKQLTLNATIGKSGSPGSPSLLPLPLLSLPSPLRAGAEMRDELAAYIYNSVGLRMGESGERLKP